MASAAPNANAEEILKKKDVTQQWEEMCNMYESDDDMQRKMSDLNSFMSNFQAKKPSSTTAFIVTSGGTRSPIEKRPVRFLDNFSSGRRGSIVVEELLKLKDHTSIVVLLARKSSLLPYERHFERFNYFEKIGMLMGTKKKVLSDKIAKQLHRLHIIEFEDLEEYLYLFRRVPEMIEKYYTRVVFFLIAAVSDFYVPRELRPENKIPSHSSQLLLSMAATPKCIYALKHIWTKSIIVIAFKLETDEEVLLDQQIKSIKHNMIEVVVGNILQNRYDRLFVLGKDYITAQTEDEKSKHLIKIEITDIERNDEIPIERLFVNQVLKYLHVIA